MSLSAGIGELAASGEELPIDNFSERAGFREGRMAASSRGELEILAKQYCFLDLVVCLIIG